MEKTTIRPDSSFLSNSKMLMSDFCQVWYIRASSGVHGRRKTSISRGWLLISSTEDRTCAELLMRTFEVTKVEVIIPKRFYSSRIFLLQRARTWSTQGCQLIFLEAKFKYVFRYFWDMHYLSLIPSGVEQVAKIKSLGEKRVSQNSGSCGKWFCRAFSRTQTVFNHRSRLW